MKDIAAMVFMAAAAVMCSGAWAADAATAKEAEAMVKKGVAYIKANGMEKGYAEISNKKGQFIDRDLYLSVSTMEAKVLAHGANEKMVGRVLIDIKDVDGKEYMRERIELAKTKSNFWQDYKFTNPVTKKVEAKTAYCERHEDVMVCGGVYKK